MGAGVQLFLSPFPTSNQKTCGQNFVSYFTQGIFKKLLKVLKWNPSSSLSYIPASLNFILHTYPSSQSSLPNNNKYTNKILCSSSFSLFKLFLWLSAVYLHHPHVFYLYHTNKAHRSLLCLKFLFSWYVNCPILHSFAYKHTEKEKIN